MTKFIRPIRVDGNLAYVPLTRGHEAIIDADDVPMVDGFNWFSMAVRGHNYAVRNRRPRGSGGLILMHRVLLGEPIGAVVDHINGDGLDNRRSNMRQASVAQNAQNSKIRSDNTSGIKGVSWDSRRKKWMASINCNRRVINLGRFDNKADAAEAYAAASARFHGEFGKIA